ncbi:MAG: 16S rRNA methyltransferase, partial [Ktedonobacteraceae bacterium]|nr:16S rRNA methyltransferase [Ktedonobacteraceae bacterium]
RNVGAQELQKRRNFKEALKATKNKLHQVGGAYFSGHEELERATNFSGWLAELQHAAQIEDQAELRRVSAKIMSNHASIKERITVLDQFYSRLFADLQPIHSVLDLACGLNPLALPWMGLADDVEYYAYDIYEHMMDFLNQYLQLTGRRGQAQACDVLQECPTREVDVALLLKALPCLEQVDKQAAHALLSTINARSIIVSYPVHSLGGRSKGMAMHYETQFRELLHNQADQNGWTWTIKKYSFETELVFLLKK